MRQEDYIIREIQKIGDLLLALMGKLQKKKDIAEVSNELQELEDVTELSLDKILLMEPGTMIDKLQQISIFNNQNLELFAKALYEMHGVLDPLKKDLALERALFILAYLDEKEQTFSMERDQLANQIKKVYS